jgi:hypothetical protein
MIDELPHPALVKQCLSSRALIESPAEVMQLLPLARAAFDTDGHWQRNGMAAILLLQLASDQLLSAANTPDGSAGLVEPQAAEEAEELANSITQFGQAADGLLDILFA